MHMHAHTHKHTHRKREQERKRNKVTLKMKFNILPGRQFNVLKEGYIIRLAVFIFKSGGIVHQQFQISLPPTNTQIQTQDSTQ